MKYSLSPIFGTRRSLLALLCASLAVSACASGPRDKTANLSEEDKLLRHKFRGIYGVVTRIDATGYPKEYVSITTETGGRLSGAGRLNAMNIKYSSYEGVFPIPMTIRATWKKGPVTLNSTGTWQGGTIIGDYTVPVAQRIPDEVLDYIRQNGGALRLKIRLHDEGIFIGWDIEMRLPIPNLPANYAGAKNYLEYRMAGGDFREATFNSVTRKMNPGWYIDKNGRKVLTDY